VSIFWEKNYLRKNRCPDLVRYSILDCLTSLERSFQELSIVVRQSKIAPQTRSGCRFPWKSNMDVRNQCCNLVRSSIFDCQTSLQRSCKDLSNEVWQSKIEPGDLRVSRIKEKGILYFYKVGNKTIFNNQLRHYYGRTQSFLFARIALVYLTVWSSLPWVVPTKLCDCGVGRVALIVCDSFHMINGSLCADGCQHDANGKREIFERKLFQISSSKNAA